jgi:anaerobic selenocysteine-containing dehydrogenase
MLRGDDSFLMRPLRVVRFIASRKGDEERGPAVWIHPSEAQRRIITDGELAWVYGPRRHELAEVRIDETVPPEHIVVRDIAGVTASETVRVVKPDLDTMKRGKAFV